MVSQKTGILVLVLIVASGCESDFDRGYRQGVDDAGSHVFRSVSTDTDIYFMMGETRDRQPSEIETPEGSAEFQDGYVSGWRESMAEFHAIYVEKVEEREGE